MRFQVVETKVFIVDSYDETTAQMAVDALQNEMQITERCFDEAKHGNCTSYGKVIEMAETTNIFVAQGERTMANYCSNCIAFYGNDLNKLELLRKLMDGECKYIRDFVMKCGYIEVEALEFTDGRDTFVEVPDDVIIVEEEPTYECAIVNGEYYDASGNKVSQSVYEEPQGTGTRA